MTDERPRPEYGEYATPEQQAAAMGKYYVAPVPVAAPVAHVRTDVTPAGATVPRNEQDQLRSGGSTIDRFASIFQLGIGLAFLINSNYFQFAEALNSASTELGLSTTFPVLLDQLGGVILAVNIALYVFTALFVYSRIRRGKLAFFLPIIGFAVFYAFIFVVLSVFVQSSS
jgi:hypothetical protein